MFEVAKKRKRKLSGTPAEEPPAKRLNSVGTPKFTSTPHHTASKAFTASKATTPKNGHHTPDSGLPGSHTSRSSGGGSSKGIGSSPALKTPIRKLSANATPQSLLKSPIRKLSAGSTTPQSLLKSVLKPGGSSAANKSTPLSSSSQLSRTSSSGGYSSSKGLTNGGNSSKLSTPCGNSSKLTTPGSNLTRTPVLGSNRKRLNGSIANGLKLFASAQKTPNRPVCKESKRNLESFLEEFSSHPVTPAVLKELMTCILLSKGPGLIIALEKLRENLDNLEIDHAGLIDQIALLPWAHHPYEISKAFRQFFISLLVHHPFYNKTVIKSLLCQFTIQQQQKEDGDPHDTTVANGVVSGGAVDGGAVINPQKNINSFIKMLLRTLPSERKEVLKQIGLNFPYYKGLVADKFTNYLRGILGLYDYLSDAGGDIIQIAFESVIGLDASILKPQLQQYAKQSRTQPKETTAQKLAAKLALNNNNNESVSSEEGASAGEEAVDDSSDSEDDSDDEASAPPLPEMDLVQCRKMDECMHILFTFVKEKAFITQEAEPTKDVDKDSGADVEESKEKVMTEVFSPEKAKPVVQTMLTLFTSHILASSQLHNLQFIIFYLVNQNKSYVKEFISLNWDIFKCVNKASIIRQAAITHFSSFLCRSLEVKAKLVKKWLKQLFKWLHDYTDLDSSSACDYMAVNLTLHGPFYSACQSAFYIIAFRHRDLVENDDVTFLRELDLTTLISHPLNPLRVLNKSVLKMFSRVLAFYQVTYCNTIIQRNTRITLPVIGLSSAVAGDMQGKPLLLDNHFPYDPYMLPKTLGLIEPMFRQFEGLKDYVSETESEDEESREGDKRSDISLLSRQRTLSLSSRRSRKISVTDLISRELDII